MICQVCHGLLNSDFLQHSLPSLVSATAHEHHSPLRSGCSQLTSDSPSSRTSYSRPSTPHGHTTPSHAVRTRKSSSPPVSDFPYSMPPKAERILGLSPGTLPHARAALESAKEEVRRLDTPIAPFFPLEYTNANGGGGGGMRGKIDRAVKAMSVALPSGTKIPGVVVGVLGGKEEEERRERVRRANDGVLFWQREVARLSAEEQMTAKSRKRK